MGPVAKKLKVYQDLYRVVWIKLEKLLEKEKVKIHERGL